MFKYIDYEPFDWSAVLNDKEAEIVNNLCELYNYDYQRNCFIVDRLQLTRDISSFPGYDKIDGLFLEIHDSTITGMKMIYWDVYTPHMQDHEFPNSIFELENLQKLELKMDFTDSVGKEYYENETPSGVKEKMLKEYMKRPGNYSPSYIPPDIGKLYKLTYLDISCNSDITTLPLELFNLPNLTYLDIGHTGIIPIPKEILNMNKLRILYINDYQEIHLPHEKNKLLYVIRKQEYDPNIKWNFVLEGFRA